MTRVIITIITNFASLKRVALSFFLLFIFLSLLGINQEIFAIENRSILQETMGDVTKQFLDQKIQANSVKFHNLKEKYKFIFFYSDSCHYCKQFAPILKLYSRNTGIMADDINVGLSSPQFFLGKKVLATEVVGQFFGNNELIVPALFIINKKNLHTYLISRGTLTYLALDSRMKELIPKILYYESSQKYHIT